MTRYRWKLIVGFILLLGIGGGVYAILTRKQPDPEVEHVKDLGKKLFDPKSALTVEEKVEIGKQLHEEVKNLPQEKQDKVREEGREHFAKMFLERHVKEVERAEKFFDITDKAEQVKAMDAHIDEQEQEIQRWRRMGEMMRGIWGGNKSQAGTDNAKPDNNKAADDKSVAEKKPEEGKNRMFRPPSEEEREAFRRKMLDATTAAQRAKHTDYMRQLDARRVERGMPSLKEIRRGFGSR